MEREVRQAMEAAERDERVRVIVLTGAGRGFCAGWDMGSLSSIVGGRRPSRATSTRRSRPDGYTPRAVFQRLHEGLALPGIHRRPRQLRSQGISQSDRPGYPQQGPADLAPERAPSGAI